MNSSRHPDPDSLNLPDPTDAFDLEQIVPAPIVLHKGRGATGNMQGRFEVDQRQQFDDGWGEAQAGDDEELGRPSLRTEVFEEHAKTMLSRNASPDVPFNVSLNPYRGCEHGCIYCFARPTHSYLGLSPGLDFESRIYAKVNAAQVLRRELAHRSYRPEPIAVGVVTDAYQPVERDLHITRQVLEVLHAHRHPLAVITKSSLIERDIDLLAPLAAAGRAIAAITITTLDPVLARALEPRAATPSRRLRTIRTLVEAGIPVGVSVAPLIPFVTEPDLERVLEACAEAGATAASYIVLRLPWEVAPLFRAWLQAHYPDRAERVMNRIREMRGGADYDSNFAHRMKGQGLWADLLKQRFDRAARQLGLVGRRHGALDMSGFYRPADPMVQPPAQRDLFG
jgi:DNA repair photolyase